MALIRCLRGTSSFCSRARGLSTFQYLEVESPQPKVYHVRLNRPNKRNALSIDMWKEIGNCFDELSNTSDCRSIVLSGNGKLFCAGIDLGAFLEIIPKQPDSAHKSLYLFDVVKQLQGSFTSLERCKKPIIAAIHNACVGGGVDMVTAADIRIVSADAYFQVKEVDLGIVADVGTIQRLPKIMGNQSAVSEMCLTGRKVHAAEAMSLGMVSQVYDDKESLIAAAINLAGSIASKSPVAVQGTKSNLVYSRNHSVDEGLERVALWNAAMLLGGDPLAAMTGGNNFEDPS